MPYLNVRLSVARSTPLMDQLAAMLMRHTSGILGKKPEVTSIAFDFVPAEQWYVGGSTVQAQQAVTFYFDIKITDGTNTKAQKAAYVKAVFADFEAILGPIAPASYIVIDDVRADAWGFQGRTQEYRFIDSQSL